MAIEVRVGINTEIKWIAKEIGIEKKDAVLNVIGIGVRNRIQIIKKTDIAASNTIRKENTPTITKKRKNIELILTRKPAENHIRRIVTGW